MNMNVRAFFRSPFTQLLTYAKHLCLEFLSMSGWTESPKPPSLLSTPSWRVGALSRSPRSGCLYSALAVCQWFWRIRCIQPLHCAVFDTCLWSWGFFFWETPTCRWPLGLKERLCAVDTTQSFKLRVPLVLAGIPGETGWQVGREGKKKKTLASVVPAQRVGDEWQEGWGSFKSLSSSLREAFLTPALWGP